MVAVNQQAKQEKVKGEWWKKAKAGAKKIGQSILTWGWTKRLLHWIIISAGTMAECVFLIASLWVSINANVHPFVRLFLSEETTKHITELATTAYVALPECIVGLAVVVTLSHLRVWVYHKSDVRPLMWGILYGLPTIVFLVLSLITLGCSVASVTFLMPTPLVVIRALAGYCFAFTSLLYTQLGLPQEKDRLAEKDALLESSRQQNEQKLTDLANEKDTILTELRKQNAGITAELTEVKTLLEHYKTTERALIDTAYKSDEAALAGYSEECIAWVKREVKTVSIDEIIRFTGHSKRKIQNAITAGKLHVSPRNKTLILLPSLVEWLKENVPSPGKNDQDTGPLLQVVKVEKAIDSLQQNGHHPGTEIAV